MKNSIYKKITSALLCATLITTASSTSFAMGTKDKATLEFVGAVTLAWVSSPVVLAATYMGMAAVAAAFPFVAIAVITEEMSKSAHFYQVYPQLIKRLQQMEDVEGVFDQELVANALSNKRIKLEVDPKKVAKIAELAKNLILGATPENLDNTLIEDGDYYSQILRDGDLKSTYEPYVRSAQKMVKAARDLSPELNLVTDEEVCLVMIMAKVMVKAELNIMFESWGKEKQNQDPALL